MCDKDRVDEELYNAFGIFEVPDSLWPVLESDSHFRAYAAENTVQGYRRCAFIAYGASTMQGDTGKPRSRASYEKPSARDRYRRMTQFAADAFRLDVVNSVRLTPEQQERPKREAFSVIACHNYFELRIGTGKSLETIRRRPNWHSITERWNQANPAEQIADYNTFRRYYSRFVKSLGYVPRALSFADAFDICDYNPVRTEAEVFERLACHIESMDSSTNNGAALLASIIAHFDLMIEVDCIDAKVKRYVQFDGAAQSDVERLVKAAENLRELFQKGDES